MFKKLLSNLPFNPGLIHQVSFYTKRVKRESAIRRTGLVFLAMAMVVQFIAVTSPAQASLDQSTNDIIPGGFSSKEQAYQYCLHDNYNFAAILSHYQISCDNINKGSVSSLKSTDYSRQLYSVGHNSYAGKLPHKEAVEVPQTIQGVGPVYWRPLWAWDTGAYSTYTAVSGKGTAGQQFFILFNCGNLVIIGKPTSAAPTPIVPKTEIVNKTTIPGTIAANSTVRPGDTLGYRIFFKNSGNGAAANVFVEDSIPAGTSFVSGSQGSGAADRYSYIDSVYPGHGQEPHVYWVYNNFPAGATGYYVDFKVKVNAGATNGQQICNTAFIRSNQTTQTQSPNKVCHTVKVTAPPPPVTPPSTPPPVTIVPTPPPATPTPPTKPCDKSETQDDAKACLVLGKSARNLSQKSVNADGTTVAPNDTIEYTLSVSNTGKVTVKDFVVEESIGDLLDYATVTDYHGGKASSSHVVSWPEADIKAGETLQKLLTIKIKSPVPQTNTPKSNPGSFDCLITNVYNNTVNIKIPCSVAKTTEQVTTKALPNTGPGTSLLIGFSLTVVVAYFFARSKLFATELDLVREDFAQSGGI